MFNNDNTIDSSSNNIKKTILVMNGCGVKGSAFIGALQALDDLNILQAIETFACSSAPALLVGIHLLGYSCKDIFNILLRVDLSAFGFVSDPLNLFENFHVSNFNVFELTFAKLAKNKNINPDITLKELFEKTKKTFIVTATCINEKKVYYVSYKNFPELKVIDAIKMTIAIPLYFPPVYYNNKMFVDGGCIDNFPIKLFDNELDKVFGIYVESEITECAKYNNLLEYVNGIIDCLKVSMNNLSKDKYLKYIINITIKQDNILEFNMSNEKKQTLYDTGYNTIKNFDFNTLI
jgi:predicted acylesterase/phospholipase RssA